jgi:RimJ/RimL family protein N-acetyltransferase
MIEKYDLRMRLVEESDAEFILSLRTDESLNQFLSKTSTSLSAQIDWIRNYKIREEAGNEYYFIAIDENGRRIGTTRLYNFEDDCFETGSWIFSKDAPYGASIKADVIGREYGFERLKVNFCKFEVRKKNLNVVRYHKAYKPDLVGEDELNYYFKIDKSKFSMHSQKLIKLLS